MSDEKQNVTFNIINGGDNVTDPILLLPGDETHPFNQVLNTDEGMNVFKEALQKLGNMGQD